MEQSPAQLRILDAAERLCQTQGFNGFSFRDLANIVGIRTASIHYHFPTKADLGKALVVRYRQKIETALGEMERRESTAGGRLRRFAAMLREVLRNENRMCLCGILAADANSINDEMRRELHGFFVVCETWLARQMQSGRERGELTFAGSPDTAARAVLATLEGAMLTSRAFGDDQRLVESSQWMLTQFASA